MPESKLVGQIIYFSEQGAHYYGIACMAFMSILYVAFRNMWRGDGVVCMGLLVGSERMLIYIGPSLMK